MPDILHRDSRKNHHNKQSSTASQPTMESSPAIFFILVLAIAHSASAMAINPLEYHLEQMTKGNKVFTAVAKQTLELQLQGCLFCEVCNLHALYMHPTLAILYQVFKV